MNVNEWLLFEECHVPCIKPTTAAAPNWKGDILWLYPFNPLFCVAI
jgi:hypothetical protein